MIKVERWVCVAFLIMIVGLFVVAAQVYATPIVPNNVLPPPTPAGYVATETELALARAEWVQSAHADTYDNGMGANTTCARCKSPMNWNPSRDIAQLEALDCGACKRIPGAPRPELPSGVVVEEADWQDINCAVCHIPADDSYYTSIAFWNQALGQYEAVDNAMDLCDKCHEGRHGFEVVEEQEASIVHKDWDCIQCHGAHGAPSYCEDCHDPNKGKGVKEHQRHSQVNCTGCHDAGGLRIWFDSDLSSRHFQEYIGVRFAHTMTSWPSHNLRLEVDCRKCHHPKDYFSSATVSTMSCLVCHPEGAVLVWCNNFPRNPEPGNTSELSP